MGYKPNCQILHEEAWSSDKTLHRYNISNPVDTLFYTEGFSLFRRKKEDGKEER